MTHQTSRDLASPFDPARDGFGFRNPLGKVPHRAGAAALLKPFDSFLYGNGLCFGMAVAALAWYRTGASKTPVSSLAPTAELLELLRDYHARQIRPCVVAAAVSDWLASSGGKPAGVLDRLRLPDDPDPHVLNFGPLANRRFFSCLYHAHAVVPYRVERAADGVRLYVYDPNYPSGGERFVLFRGGEFSYGGFGSREGWGITPLPLSAAIP